jgi:hypothetical protein
MMVVYRDWLAPYHGTAREEQNEGGSSGSNRKAIATGRKARPITDVGNTALGKVEMAVRL